jgi:hypothetical protein
VFQVETLFSGLGLIKKTVSAIIVRQINSMLLFFFIQLICLTLTAQIRKTQKVAKIAFGYDIYSGATNKSFSEGQPGYGAEISIDDGGANFRYFLKSRFIYSSGTQNFLDGSTVVLSNYALSHLAPEVGISFYPVARKSSGLNLYMWASGIVSYSLLELTPISTTSGSTTTAVTSYSVLRRKDQGYGYGFGAGVGIEFYFGQKNRSSKTFIYADVGFREQQANLAQRTDFQINTMAFNLGLGF